MGFKSICVLQLFGLAIGLALANSDFLLPNSSIQHLLQAYLEGFERPLPFSSPQNNRRKSLLRNAMVVEPTLVTSTLRMPQSFAILMNFGSDGTSSLQLMESMDSIYWADVGYCKHGQMYDPLNKRCSDIFCLSGAMLMQLSNNGYSCNGSTTTGKCKKSIINV